jgi:hypothetical protein
MNNISKNELKAWIVASCISKGKMPTNQEVDEFIDTLDYDFKADTIEA